MMNPIIEEGPGDPHENYRSSGARGGSQGSLASLASSSTRSGIKMGSVSLGHHRAVRAKADRPTTIRPLDPASLIDCQAIEKADTTTSVGTSQLPRAMAGIELNESSDQIHSDSDDETQSEESDWEQDVDNEGSVHFVDPFTTEEAAGLVQRAQHLPPLGIHAGHRPEVQNQAGKKLSRLVRRRESKRDRNTSCNVVLKTPGGSEAASGGQLSKHANSNWRLSNSHESSDNDSSTYGQIKTFEAFFQASNLDTSVASPPLPVPPTVPPNRSSNNDLKDDSSHEVTEIHEVTLKFQSKELKAQVPHFQMLLHGDNPSNRGLLLEALLGIVPEVKPLPAEGSKANVIVDNSVVIASLVPQGIACRTAENLKCGDIIRSLDGHHVTLDTVNTYLLNKLAKTSSSSASGKVKLILQRPNKSAAGTFFSGSGYPGGNPLNPMSEADLLAKRNAIADHYSQLDDHAWNLLSNANVIVGIVSNSIEDNETSSGAAADGAPSVLYLLPSSSQSEMNPLVAIRGMFSTLAQLLPDIVQSCPVSSSLMVNAGPNTHNSTEGAYNASPQAEQQQWMHVSYAVENDEILFLALPGKKNSTFLHTC